jgi:hypothetical protein
LNVLLSKEVQSFKKEVVFAMNEKIQMNNQSEIEMLKNFINENKELEKLESITDKFNIFRSLDVVNNELKHSNFLAWLMDPTETHGLGDYFLTAFLKKVSSKKVLEESESPSIFDIDSWNFNYIEILREWRNIDILIKSDENRFVCVIENKINSSESQGQLRKYKNIIESEFPSYKKLFVFLTLEGEIPSDETYFSINYKDILSILNYLIDAKNDELGKDILIFISHYRDMLGRYVLEDSKIQEICKRIYKKHKKALDLIFEYKPDKTLETHDIIVDFIKNKKDMILDSESKKFIRFIPKNLDFIPKEGENWTKSKRILLFEINISHNGVNSYLIIGPGPQVIRDNLYTISKDKKIINANLNRKMTPKWFTVNKKNILRANEFKGTDGYDLRDLIEKRLKNYFNIEVPKIIASIEESKTIIKDKGVKSLLLTDESFFGGLEARS